MHLPHVRQGQPVEGHALLLGELHHGADGMVRGAERDAAPHQVVGQVGRQQRGIGHGGGA